ncbi:MAG: alpha/beta hydrolase fold domain-containing protein [Gammaproteobacteria bacterium]
MNKTKPAIGRILPVVLFLFAAPCVFAEASTLASKAGVVFKPDGAAHIIDLNIPIPATISPQAAALIRASEASPDTMQGLTAPIETLRRMSDEKDAKTVERLLQLYPATVRKTTLGGVVVRFVTPEKIAPGRQDQLLINLHGGAFIIGEGSLVEAVPIAFKSGIPVLAIDYRLAPSHPFPAAVDDVISVYRELLKTHNSKQLSIYGSSAGAVLSAQAAVRMLQLGLPVPASLGFFSGTADFSRPGDTESLFGVLGFSAHVTPVAIQAAAYLTDHDRRDPVMSPIYADLKTFPPTLCMSGTRDFFLSSTSNFHRALLRAGVASELVVFDAMPHVHWTEPDLPESDEALDLQAAFLARHTGS